MLTRTLLREARLDSAIVTPVPDQTSLKVAMFFILIVFRLYSVSPPPLPTAPGSSDYAFKWVNLYSYSFRGVGTEVFILIYLLECSILALYFAFLGIIVHYL